MSRIRTLAAALAVCFLPAAFPASSGSAPKIDKAKIEAYVRYAEGFTPEVKMTVDDPSPSPFEGLYRIAVHLSFGAQNMDRVYYITSNGQRMIKGDVWDLHEDPFRANLELLPKDGPAFGPKDAKVTIVVFSDFQCPYCRELAKTIRDNVPQKYPKDVRVIFKDFPISSMHPWARAAAEASHCIASQKPEAFWAYHDWIFENQQDVDPTTVKTKSLDFARQQGLDVLQLSSCMDTHATAAEVDQSRTVGQSLQVDRTPTMFINGRMIPTTLKWETLESVIKLELNRPKDLVASKDEKCCEVTMPTVSH
ncbi:MAG TPA: thioredoxin domain-containing protein [Bryobacteraceae bacterium]|jgi:protein-disulfide isomerase|nr:thioredoxin domain-containing protein [Bryobacteraceae bacterium]